MPDQLQLRGGTTAQHTSFTGASKEVTVDTTKKTAVVHDGSTAGGNPLLREDGSNSALSLGSAGTPSLKFTGDTNTGIYSPGADQVAISTGGTGRLFVDSSGRIKVGASAAVGALNVRAATNGNLHVVDISTMTGSGTGVGLDVQNDIGNINDLAIRGSNTTFRNASGEAMRITSAGLVGIGTTSPSSPINTGRLMVQGGDIVVRDNNVGNAWRRGTLVFDIRNSNEDSKSAYIQSNIVSDVSSTLQFFTTATHSLSERMRIDDAGRLLVGTSSTSADTRAIIQGRSSSGDSTGRLHISSGNNAPGDGDGIAELYFTSSGHVASGRIAAQRDGGTWTAGSSLPTRLVFSTTADGASSQTERMRISSNGTVSFYYGLSFSDRGTTKGISTPDWRVYNSTSNQYIIDNYSVGVKLDNNATAWSTVSDERQKTNLEPIKNGLSKVATLRAVTGRYLADAEDVSRSFLIAQDVQAVLPEAVTVESDEDATLSLRYTEVIPLFVAALKESKERIEQLEATNADLLARVSALEST